MHKAVILLVKAEDRETAVSNAQGFMEGYKDNVWDWYVVGGRWSGVLNSQLQKDFKKFLATVKKNKLLKSKLSSDLTNDDYKSLKPLWGKLNPKYPHHNPFDRGAYTPGGRDDDALPLSDCISIVKKWAKNYEAEEVSLRKEVIQNAKKKKPILDGYTLYRLGQRLMGMFSFDTNVFDVDYGGIRIPPKKEWGNYYAVIVDMHN